MPSRRRGCFHADRGIRSSSQGQGEAGAASGLQAAHTGLVPGDSADGYPEARPGPLGPRCGRREHGSRGQAREAAFNSRTTRTQSSRSVQGQRDPCLQAAAPTGQEAWESISRLSARPTAACAESARG